MPAAPSTAASVQKLMPVVPLTSELPSASTALDEQPRQRVIRRQLVGRPRERQRGRARRTPDRPARAPSRIALTSSSAPSPLSPPISRRSICSRQRSGYELSSRPPLTIEACSEPVPMIGCGGRDCSVAVEHLEPLQHASHAQDGVPAVPRAAAVRGAPARLDVDPGEALVTDADLQVGGFGDDRARRPSSSRTSASAPMLAYSSSTTAATISRPSFEATLGRRPRRVNHGGHAALHVLRTAAVEAVRRISGVNGASMPSTPTVSMCPQNISDRPGARPSSTPMTFGRPGATSCSCTSSPMRRMCAGDRRRDPRFARGARHERRVDRVDGDEIAQEVDGRDPWQC